MRSRLAERAMRLALLAFPVAFRARYGGRLVRDFLDHLDGLVDASSWRRARFVVAAFTDAVLCGLRERLDVRGARGHVSSLVEGFSPTVRVLRRSPGFATVVVVTLALGIGANATMYGVAERLLLTPPPHVTDPDRVVQIHFDRLSPFNGTRSTSAAFAYPDLGDMGRVGAFASVAGFSNTRATLGSGEGAERIRVQMADGTLFGLLGVRPHAGRFFGPGEDRIEGGVPVAVLGHGFWIRRFGGSTDVLGREIRIGRERYTVVGVAPAGFTGPTVTPVDVWLPLRTMQAVEAGDGWVTSRRWYWFAAVARLREGATVAAAEAEATAAHRAGRSDEVAAGRYDGNARAVLGSLIPARGPNVGAEVTVSRWLVGVSLVVLLISCANVANLLLLRAVRRRRESAIRLALGVSRARLFLQFLVESLLLASLAGAAALVGSRWGSAVIYRTLLSELDPGDGPAGVRLFVFTAGAAVTAALLAGVVPALQASRADVASDLRSAGRTTPGSGRLRSGLLMAQVSLSVVLLTGAGLFLRSLSAVHRLDLGFDPVGVLVARLETDDGSFTDETSEAVRVGMERLRGAPGVESAALASLAPLEGLWGLTLRHESGDTVEVPLGPFHYVVSSDYFHTMGMRIERGRSFTEEDMGPGAPPVMILTEDLAARAFGTDEPLGRCLFVESPGEEECTRIVGVLADHSAAELVEELSPIVYLPLGHPAAQAPQTLVVRADDPRGLLSTVRATLLEAVPGARFASVTPLEDLVESQRGSWRLGATLFTLFGGLALAVAGLGLYAVVGFDVAQRRSELGIRAAMGAPGGRLAWAVVRPTVVKTGVGVTVGLAASVALARVGRDLLFGVAPTDPLAIGVAGLGLLAVAALAALRPSLAAARVPPSDVLRSD